MAQALKQARIVVLGDPGAGKTTLLRYLARAAAVREPGLAATAGGDLLPVYVRLGEYEQFCTRQQQVSLMDYAPITARTRELPLTAALLAAEAEQGRCLFLLDGLDEVLHVGQRGYIRERIDELARHRRNCRVVVTSRIVGYRDAQLPRGDDGFAHFTLSPLDDGDIEQFARRWYDAIRTTGDLTDPARQNAQALVQGIHSLPGVRRLAANPLLMTLIALIYWREVRLPRRRIELYASAVRMLLTKWVQARTPDVRLSEREATSLLMAVAFHVHQTSSAGLITRGDLERLLLNLKTDPERGGLSEFEAQKEVEEFLGVQGEHVGLLYPRGFGDLGQEVFGFLHLTFEEYCAGRKLARLWKQGKFPLTSYLHRPRWEEPVLLACAHLSDEDDDRAVNEFVRQILEAGSPYEKPLHRDLLLAARCLADEANVSRELTRRIFEELDQAFTTSIIPLNERIQATVAAMRGSRVAADAVAVILPKLDAENDYLRSAAAGALGSLGEAVALPGVLAGLLQRLDDPEDGVRSAAAQVLGLLGEAAARPEVLAGLLQRLDDPEDDVRFAAAQSLGRLGEAAATKAILDRLAETAYDSRARGMSLEDVAFRALAQLVPDYRPSQVLVPADAASTAPRRAGTQWTNWLTGPGPATSPENLPPLPNGFPVLNLRKARLQNIKAFSDSGEVNFTAADGRQPRPWTLLLGDNAAGKSTFLRCVALAAHGTGVANELESRVASYLRSGAERGFIEAVFALQPYPDSEPAEIGTFTVGLEIRKGETAFRAMSDNDLSMGTPNAADRLSLLRNRADLHFGLICGYGALRGLTDDPEALVRESGKVAHDRVASLFAPHAPLIDPEVLGKLLAGDLSNFRNAPSRLSEALRQEVLRTVRCLLPGAGEFNADDSSRMVLYDTRVAFRDLSDGYGGLLALLGHLLHHALGITKWQQSPAAVPGLVLLDEVDLHLHPAWQRRLLPDLSRAFPNLQIIGTSHSAVIAAAAPPDALIVLRREEGVLRVRTDLPSVKGWRVDQVLTSMLFDLSSTRDQETEQLTGEYARLINERGPDDGEVQALEAELARRRPENPGSTPLDRAAWSLLEDVIRDRLAQEEPARQEALLSTLRKMLYF
ncbi:MAG TPA: AAA family ATPase [Gemmataceae bacterium]|nr:AAA family ATPase [Gemmataceae bacterium]